MSFTSTFFCCFDETEKNTQNEMLSGVACFFSSGQTIAQTIYLSGLVIPPPLCSGMGKCGRCRIRIPEHSPVPAPEPVKEDYVVLTPDDIANGWRLGCHHFPVHSMLFQLPESIVPAELFFTRTGKEKERVPPSLSNNKEEKKETSTCFLGIDFGTTSVQFIAEKLVKESQTTAGEAAAKKATVSGQIVNPQIGAGSDVISRLAFASSSEGCQQLSLLARNACESFCQQARENGLEPKSLCFAGNTAMTSIFLGKDTKGLAHAPYSLPISGGTWEHVASLPPVWIPPQISPFVGGDISAGYADIVFGQRISDDVKYPFILGDLGTNGEFILALEPNKAFVASVALGPALEGIGLSFGAEAREGVIVGFQLTPMGLVPEMFAPENQHSTQAQETGHSTSKKATSERLTISGTGYLSLLHRLLSARALSKDGQFTIDGSILNRYYHRVLPMLQSKFPERLPADEPFFPLFFDNFSSSVLFLPASDIEEILKVKAAFNLGMKRLLEIANVPFSDIATVYLAGSLGRYVDKGALEALGFIPEGAASRVSVIGNSSLYGACLLANDETARKQLVEWSKKVQPIDLANDTVFKDQFFSHMRFSW